MNRFLFIFFLFSGLIFISCKKSSSEDNQDIKGNIPGYNGIVYQTDNLVIHKLSNHLYVHVSFLNTNDFGKVACNGMMVINEHEGILFDTPTDNNSSKELFDFITKELKTEISAIIPTHFHSDCVGGIELFESYDIPMYASNKTIRLLKSSGQHFTKPLKGFGKDLSLDVGNKKVYAKYFGEGHTEDNIIGYFPEGKAIFGGCLIKEVGAGKGYLGDANTDQWAETVHQIKTEYPEVHIVVPGHGKWGGTELLEYTAELFEVK